MSRIISSLFDIPPVRRRRRRLSCRSCLLQYIYAPAYSLFSARALRSVPLACLDVVRCGALRSVRCLAVLGLQCNAMQGGMSQTRRSAVRGNTVARRADPRCGAPCARARCPACPSLPKSKANSPLCRSRARTPEFFGGSFPPAAKCTPRSLVWGAEHSSGLTVMLVLILR